LVDSISSKQQIPRQIPSLSHGSVSVGEREDFSIVVIVLGLIHGGMPEFRHEYLEKLQILVSASEL